MAGVCVGGVLAEVVVFARILDVVVELDARFPAFAPFGVAPALGPHAATDRAAVDLGVGGLFSGLRGVFEDGAQALAGEFLGRGEASVVGQRRVKVDELGDGCGGFAHTFRAGDPDDHRGARAEFVDGDLVPPAMLAEMITVVADQDHDGVVPQLVPLQRSENAAYLRVGETNPGLIRALELAALAVGERGEVRLVRDRVT